MARKKGVEVVLLYEDQQHYRFALRVFQKLGYHHRELRFRVSPSGRGAAEARVRREYPKELAAHRRRAARRKAGLLVFIDADTSSVDERRKQLGMELTKQDMEDRQPDEAVALWIPRRHIETWLLFLLRQDVTEEQDCKRKAVGVDPREPAKRFVEIYHDLSARSNTLLPSLRDAMDELDRMPRQPQ